MFTTNHLDLFADFASMGSYPPVNIYKLKDNTYLEMAVAGFKKSELDVEFDGRNLVVTGTKAPRDAVLDDKKDGIIYHHRGLAYRNFRREFLVDEKVEVDSVSILDGVLIVKMKPKADYQAKKLKITQIDEFPAGPLLG